MQIEEHLGLEEPLELLAGRGADRLDRRAALADQDRLLGLPFDQDRAVQPQQPLRALGLLDPATTNEQLRPLADRLMEIAYDPSTMAERVQLVAQEVVATLYDWPVRLTSEMVYFMRTATLIEGLGVRYDPHFNPITFASPIAIRMRSQIERSLGLSNGKSPIDMPTIVGAALGKAARVAVDWWNNLLVAGNGR